MLPIIASAISALGSIFGSIFQTKQARLEAYATTLGKVTDVLKEANYTDAQISQAVATIIAAEAQSDSWIAKSWRPITMLLIGSLIASWMYGVTPPNINGQMSPFMAECFELFKIGLCGYMPARSLEKIIKTIMTPKIVETIVKSLTSKGII